MNELALFAGAGGGILGAKLLGWRTVCAVEIDPYCRRVLMQRQNDGVLPAFPIWDDVRTFDGAAWRGKVDVVTAGVPCQPHSLAGKRLGEEDDRYLWPDTIRILREVRSRWALLENVPGFVVDGGLPFVLRELAKIGYDARWDFVPAFAIGAPHIRNRIWIAATTASVVHAQRWNPWVYARNDRTKRERRRWLSFFRDGHWRPGRPWPVEPGIRRVAYGLPDRVDRKRALGNGQVPAVVVRAWELLSGDTP
jgi:DNA (cytosine-5)-methyltransferase 1